MRSQPSLPRWSNMRRCINPRKIPNAGSAEPATGNGLGDWNGCVDREPSVKYTCTINGKEYRIEIVDDRLINVNGRELTMDFKRIGDQQIYSLLLGGQSYDAFVYSAEAGWEVQIKNRQYTVAVEGERSKRMYAAAGGRVNEIGAFRLNAPMPGLVVAIFVEEGQEIQKGQVLMILESMKMQNEIKAPRGGTVGELRVKPGESVEQRQALLSIF